MLPYPFIFDFFQILISLQHSQYCFPFMFQQKWQIDDLQVLRHDSSTAALSMTDLPNQFFQWFICTSPKARLSQTYKIHTVNRYFEKCFCTLTRCPDCIAFPSSYARNKSCFFVSSSRKPVIFLVTECPCVLADVHWHTAGLQTAFPSNCRINFLA